VGPILGPTFSMKKIVYIILLLASCTKPNRSVLSEKPLGVLQRVIPLNVGATWVRVGDRIILIKGDHSLEAGDTLWEQVTPVGNRIRYRGKIYETR